MGSGSGTKQGEPTSIDLHDGSIVGTFLSIGVMLASSSSFFMMHIYIYRLLSGNETPLTL